MVAVTEFIGLVTEDDVDNAFVRANAALTEALQVLGEFDAQGGWEIAGAGSAESLHSSTVIGGAGFFCQEIPITSRPKNTA